MPSLLLVIFVVELAIHVVNSVGASALSELAWMLFNKLPTPSSNAVNQASKQQREVLRIKKEMNNVSAQDDFARWAKLRRQHDKAVADYDKTTASLKDSKSKFTTAVGSTRWMATSGVRLILLFWYVKSPMFWVPAGWIPGYAEWLLSWPKAPLGSVSIQVWSWASASAIALLSEAVAAAWALGTGQTAEKTTTAPQPMPMQSGDSRQSTGAQAKGDI